MCACACACPCPCACTISGLLHASCPMGFAPTHFTAAPTHFTAEPPPRVCSSRAFSTDTYPQHISPTHIPNTYPQHISPTHIPVHSCQSTLPSEPHALHYIACMCTHTGCSSRALSIDSSSRSRMRATESSPSPLPSLPPRYRRLGSSFAPHQRSLLLMRPPLPEPPPEIRQPRIRQPPSKQPVA